jgi:hypothetical protein
MSVAKYSMGEDYWEAFKLRDEDLEFLYNYLLEVETPLTSQELVEALVVERIRLQKLEIERQRTSGGDLYQPKGTYKEKQKLIFPAMGWRHGDVVGVRSGLNPELGEFQVIQVAFEDGSLREFASGLAEHKLNEPPKVVDDFNHLDKNTVLKIYSDDLLDALEEGLSANPDFVRIAGRWFPRALLVDINVGHLNLAEAVLDMSGGGPLSTNKLLEQIELNADVNPKLVEFSLDLALQEDPRFDEVGPAGDVLWFLRRLEPPEVLNTPIFLRYAEIEYDRSILTPEMLALEQALDDELSPPTGRLQTSNDVEVRLIYPHLRSGTLPLSSRLRHLFPTAYEAPRVRLMLVDGESGEQFPGWVVREKRYVYGLQDFYETHGMMPGSILHVRKGKNPGEVIVQTDSRRPSREWIRTVLVGSDGGVVFAMLKQIVSTPFDERMAVAIPDRKALDQVWTNQQKDLPPFERVIVNIIKELAKLNPQSHVHASELYAAVNVVRRLPPGPILALLASRPWFIHVGDQHYRLSDADYD